MKPLRPVLIIATLLVSWFRPVPVIAQPSTKAATSSASSPRFDGPRGVSGHLPGPSHLFWVLRTEKTTIYLLGSVHVGQKRMYPLPHRIERALAESNILVIEADTRGAKKQALQDQISRIGFFSDGRTLSRALGQPLFDMAFERLRQQSIPAEAIDRMKPWAASLVLGHRRKGGPAFTSYWGVEDYLLRQVQPQTTVEELEGAEMQLAALDAIPDKAQVAMVREAIEGKNDVTPQLMEAWERGNENLFAKMFLQSFGEVDLVGAYEILIQKRNVGMTDRIVDYAQRGGTIFVVAGAGHFVGPDSIILMLKKRGLRPARM